MSITSHLPRYPLAFLPTPLHPLPRLSEQLAIYFELPADGFQLWIKRDDQTGLATGGNKTRKLEFLVADALAQGADTFLTVGAAQSNHCRQAAAAALQAGLECHVILTGPPPAEINGNLLLDQLLGAHIHWAPREERLARMAALAEELRGAGRHPYTTTFGGSDPVGACGYVLAMEELFGQVTAMGLKLDAIITASSSSGTQAGLVVGAWVLGWDVPILGISIDETQANLQAKVADLATRTASYLGHPHTFAPEDIWVNADYLGAGYGIMGELEREAIYTLARTEGVLLDPVYTGRAFGGLLDLIRHQAQALPQPTRAEMNYLFWHTGGVAALFAYADQLPGSPLDQSLP